MLFRSHAGYLGVTAIIRQLGRYLTLALRIPEDLALAYDASQDLQLCVNGCPGGERIDRGGRLSLPPPRPPPALGLQRHPPLGPPAAPAPWGFTEEGARGLCREELEEQDIYYHSCVGLTSGVCADARGLG